MTESELPTEDQILALKKGYKIGDKIVKPTAKQFAFVRFYVLNGRKGTEAAIQAGYSEKTAAQMATENLSKPLIKMMLEDLEIIMIQKYIMSYDKKRAMLGKMAEASGAIIDIKDKNGKSLGFKAPVDIKGAVAAIGEDNKMAGHHHEKEEHLPDIHIHLTSLDMAL